MTEERVPVSAAGTAALFSRTGTELDDVLPRQMQRAIERMRVTEVADLRHGLISRAGTAMAITLTRVPSIEIAASLLASLGEVGHEITIDPQHLITLATNASLEDLKLLLEAAYAAAPGLAAELVGLLGGPDSLMRRLAVEHPWTHNPRVVIDEQGRQVARADYLYLAAAHQADPHAEVMKLAQLIAALVPTAEEISCAALDATGRTAGFKDVPIADKKIVRRNLPSPTEVAWNRAMTRAAIATVASKTDTEHLQEASRVITLCAQLARRVANAYARGEALTNRIRNDARSLAVACDNLPPTMPAVDDVGPLDEGELSLNDPVGYIGTTFAKNVVPRLFDGDHPAPLIHSLAQQASEIALPGYWQLLSHPPVRDAEALRDTLYELWAVVGEIVHGDSGSVTEVRRAGRQGLPAAARKAREVARARMDELRKGIESGLVQKGLTGRVVLRPGPQDSDLWPADEFLLAVEVPSAADWGVRVEQIADLARPFLESRIGFWMAPIRDGRLVSELGVRVLTDIFPDESVGDWPELPVPVLGAILTAHCRRSLNALMQISGILGLANQRSLHAEELAALRSSEREFEAGFDALRAAPQAAGHDLLSAVVDELLALANHVRLEDGATSDGQSRLGLAGAVLRGLGGEANDVFLSYVALVAACVELDIDPDAASQALGWQPDNA